MKSSTHPRTQILTSDQCLALLGVAPVGRLGVVVGGRPEIYPVNHVLHEGDILFRTGSGTKLDGAVGQPVAFEVDGYDIVAQTAWSVLVTGVAEEVSRVHELLDLMRLPVFPWEPGAKPHLIRIRPEAITGREFPAVDMYADQPVTRTRR
ncbi:pyridoxamine 5'-phosphate oxidase family protein [Flexivirga oryzae]|uniref:Nitroimidazol reductase NimA-like FMN-containing flavoprotein (Pyridoxamine 5'-phosphate oxidase superfamily) n=1 Tax=Flexivirga oryzae TaxID=1794944 RepID=A0A839NC18_9MICO|nr:pyridoxamine 5'-phosphate oxidase family protein [Flexivirga oryzae]MBB2892735.1 nitroimidazol reductase NimA-like FMN-containing flavoprotein (pyridoxamine 5'-phosphate oxidase superfamily) [Flexivirga oryzae]